MTKPTLGFVGAGFVGGAMIRAFSGYNDLVVYDLGKGIGTMEEVVEKSDAIFVSLPSPMRKDGSCDTRIIEEVVMDIDTRLMETGRATCEVVLRSTVPPTFLMELGDSLRAAELVFMPEFLTERTADLDFIMASRYILGVGNNALPGETAPITQDILRARFPKTRISVVSWEEAAMIKYASNVFFTIKLSFFNELAQHCDTLDAISGFCDWENVRDELMNDGRIGRSHFNVPGPDGNLGWGGHCFPKDNRAYSYFVKDKLEQSTHMVDAAWTVNEEVREERDWESDVGRAVSED